MSKIYIAQDANKILVDYLVSQGHHLEFISSEGIVDQGISNHPDIFLCKMGIDEKAPIFFANHQDLGHEYPGDTAFNAACTGKFFIHNFTSTNERLLFTAQGMDMTLIDVRQGYTKCSIVVVAENAIITYDEGIVAACKRYSNLDVLQVSPGFVKLDGFDTGFIGGASGRIGNEVIFNGDLSAHPDFQRIVTFIEKQGLTCRWFADYKLTDIGSIL